jgi:hypothetical protein
MRGGIRISNIICYHSVQNALSALQPFRNEKINTYKTEIFFPVVLFGCETWSLTLGREHILRVFDNRALKRMLRLKRVEIIRGWRNLNNEEFHNLYSSPNIIRMIKSKRLEHVASMGEKRNAYRVLAGKLEGKRLLERFRRRRKINIRIYFSETRTGGMDWIYLAQDRDQ